MSLIGFMALVPFDFDLLCQLIRVGFLRRRVTHKMVIAA